MNTVKTLIRWTWKTLALVGLLALALLSPLSAGTCGEFAFKILDADAE